MKTFPAVLVSGVVAVGLLFGAVQLIDRLGPAITIGTEVWSGTFRPDNVDRVYYGVPSSGGELASCPVGAHELCQFRVGMPIVVHRSLLFDRCVAVERGVQVRRTSPTSSSLHTTPITSSPARETLVPER